MARIPELSLFAVSFMTKNDLISWVTLIPYRESRTRLVLLASRITQRRPVDTLEYPIVSVNATRWTQSRET